MWMTLARGLIAGVTVIGVAELSRRFPRAGALLLTLPLISIIAFIATWNKDRNLAVVSSLARETLILVPLSLPFFIPLALAPRWGLGFWPALVAGLLLASVTVGLWFWLGPKHS